MHKSVENPRGRKRAISGRHFVATSELLKDVSSPVLSFESPCVSRRGRPFSTVFFPVVVLSITLLVEPSCALANRRTHNRFHVAPNMIAHVEDTELDNCHHLDRRKALVTMATAASIVPLAFIYPAAATAELPCSTVKSLEDLSIGDARWTQANQAKIFADNIIVPATFATYASRFLIRYDDGVSSWWNHINKSYSLLPYEQRQSKLGKSFGCLAMSVDLALDQFVRTSEPSSWEYVRTHYGELAELFMKSYGRDAEARRQIGLLFALLPAEHQPVDASDRLATTTIMKEATVVDSPPRILTEDLAALLPSEFQCARIKGTQSFTIDPAISLYEVGVDEEFGQTAIATTFGPLSSTPLKRGLPLYTPNIYVAFGISGGAGCVLTHTVVIPLDVVKTRIQTDPEVSGGLLQGAASIVEREGVEGLLLGAQATIAGYLWCVL